MVKFALFLLLTGNALGLIHSLRDDVDDPGRYTICGGHRGYTEKDSLEAAQKLEDKIIFTDPFPMEREDCVFAHVNTTIISLCNGVGRPRKVTRSEVKRGINQLIKDCGLEGGFTGIHVVNNLTFAAYGVFGGIKLAGPPGSNPPDLPGGGSKHNKGHVSKRATEDCNLKYDGVERTDCPFKYKLNDDGSCGNYKNLQNNCEQFCELKRMGLLGVETRAPGHGGEAQPVTVSVTLEKGTEVSITNGFSIGVEGVYKDVVGGGLSYSWSLTTTKSYAVGQQSRDADIEHLTDDEKKNTWARWVYFPKLIKSCGRVSKSGIEKGAIPPCGTSVCPPAPDQCGSEETRKDDVCILSPLLNENGENVVVWGLRLESADGKALPMEKQSKSYSDACYGVADPDHDQENECLNDNPGRRAVDFVRMKREYEAKVARTMSA